MEQKSYTQKEISIMFNKSLSLLAHYKKELIEKGYMYKNEKGKNVINTEGAEYLRRRFAEIDQSKRKNVKKDKIILEQEVKVLQKEKEWYKDKLEYYKNQAEDWKKQESTEELTTKIISESKEIMNLLQRDGIKVEEISDYHIYPIADNDTPMLSSDRLEYTLSNGLGATEKIWGLNEIEEIYKNIEIQTNEEGIQELGFKDLKIAEKFVKTMSILSRLYRREKTVYSMQLLADIMKRMSIQNMISIDDLYSLSEKEVIEKIELCKDKKISQCFNIWRNAIEIKTSDTLPNNKYFVSIEKMKVRYINPLVRNNNKFERIYDISENAKADIEKALNYKTAKYTYLDFEL